jgi:hypothetical protein
MAKRQRKSVKRKGPAVTGKKKPSSKKRTPRKSPATSTRRKPDAKTLPPKSPGGPKPPAQRPRSFLAEAAAPTKPCLPLPQAVSLVRSCSGTDDGLPLSTPLGQIFPSPGGRASFCQCVADGVPTDRSDIPCGAGTTLQDVVDAIAC